MNKNSRMDGTNSSSHLERSVIRSDAYKFYIEKHNFLEKVTNVYKETCEGIHRLEILAEGDEAYITIAEGATIHIMVRDGLVRFQSRILRCIPRELSTYFREQYDKLVEVPLGLEIKMIENDASEADLVVKGEYKVDRYDNAWARRCALYFVLFWEEIERIVELTSRNDYEVWILSSGKNRNILLNAVRKVVGCSNEAASELLRDIPNLVIRSYSELETSYFKALFIDSGAEVDIRRLSGRRV